MGSIPQAFGGQGGERTAGVRGEASVELLGGLRPIVAGLLLVAVCFGVYAVSRPVRFNQYVHFEWQAEAWLQGQTSIPVDVPPSASSPGNDYYQDVMPVLDAEGTSTGRGIIPFPPLPALVILPFVAIWGLYTDEQLLSMILGAIDVGLAFWVLGRLPIRPSVRLLTAVFVAFGSALWYTASTGTTWYWAHDVAVCCLLLSIGVALGADADATRRRPIPSLGELPASIGGLAYRLHEAVPLDSRQLLAGLLFGLAVTARLTTLFGFPFLVLVGGGGNWLRRAFSAAAGAAIPIAALLVYTQLSTGSYFNPAYDYLYHLELGYTFLNYHPDWSLEDVRYIPQNLAIMLFNGPILNPTASGFDTFCGAGQSRSLVDAACPVLVPNGVGMSVLLTSPAYVLALPGVAGSRLAEGLGGRLRAGFAGGLSADRLTAGAAIAVVAIATVNLMHFSQGWVQFGYRFANDFMPFAILPLALGADRLHKLWPFATLIAVSIAVNLWGVAMAAQLGW